MITIQQFIHLQAIMAIQQRLFSLTNVIKITNVI